MQNGAAQAKEKDDNSTAAVWARVNTMSDKMSEIAEDVSAQGACIKNLQKTADRTEQSVTEFGAQIREVVKEALAPMVEMQQKFDQRICPLESRHNRVSVGIELATWTAKWILTPTSLSGLFIWLVSKIIHFK